MWCIACLFHNCKSALSGQPCNAQHRIPMLRLPCCQLQAPQCHSSWLPLPRCSGNIKHNNCGSGSRSGCTCPHLQSGQQQRNRACQLSSSKYDHPALYSSDDAFSLQSYWDQRYTQDQLTFEWYRDYTSLAPVLTRHLPKAGPLLQVGVGTSRIQADMVLDGFTSIHSTDYSPVAVQRLQQLHADIPALTYAVADVRRLPEYPDGSYAGVLDKGTLDALLCGDDDTAAAAQMMGEVWRLLQPGASYVMVTSAAPKSRLPYICTPQLPWTQVALYEVGQQGALVGPVVVSGSSSGQDMPQLPSLGYSHMVYVCTK